MYYVIYYYSLVYLETKEANWSQVLNYLMVNEVVFGFFVVFDALLCTKILVAISQNQVFGQNRKVLFT